MGVIIDSRMQTVLWFAGLRGAMSFALVESIPLYDAVTGEGSRMKAELKAMTSASIIFTVFVLGGCTDYIIERLGMGPSSKSETVEMTSLLGLANDRNGEGRARERIQTNVSEPERPRTTSRQRKGVRGDSNSF
jgi:NhaP-type Na+/H+ or K+/H+ antiporter